MINSQNIINNPASSPEQSGGRQPDPSLDKSDLSRCLHNVLYRKRKQVRFYHCKVTQKGKYFEVFKSQRPIFYHFDQKQYNGLPAQNIDPEKAKINKARNAYKSKRKVIDLAMCNFTEKDKFLTLTYNDLQNFDIKNIQESNKRFALFIRRLRRRYSILKYLAVIEFQDKKRKAVHYHLIYNLPFVHWSILKKLWSHGDINIRRPNDMRHITFYIPKYFNKNINDIRFKGHRSFMYSKNLIKPKKIIGVAAQSLGEKFALSSELRVVNKEEYQSDFHGKVTKILYTRNIKKGLI